jgi:hypothetical protein
MGTESSQYLSFFLFKVGTEIELDSYRMKKTFSLQVYRSVIRNKLHSFQQLESLTKTTGGGDEGLVAVVTNIGNHTCCQHCVHTNPQFCITASIHHR